MSYNTLAPKTYAEALTRKIARDAKRASEDASKPKGKALGRGKGLRARPDRKLAEWGREVKKRDSNQCQWPGISAEVIFRLGYAKFDARLALYPCATGDQRIDPHHIAEKSLRPDLKYELDNGIALCRTHHDWLPLNRQAAIALKLLSDETYELAKRGQSA